MRNNGHRHTKKPGDRVNELTLEEARALANRQAKSMLGLSADEVYRKLDHGELRGTLAETHFNMMRHLLKPK
jgi:hypothetical protein